MPAPSTPSGFPDDITGNARFRKNFLGQMVLQYEVALYLGDKAMGDPPLVWRDAPSWALYHIRYWRNQKGLEPLI